ncbi:hypothetical protein E1A91_D08G178400v1 [Gossypium mustelinum]|uniref:Uncharacterized protein n=1 Tax=Gossypium mustelinum TaxID=34275 RepID=A0A5D2TZB7_GOSMU|nr:hypothetical protein E1A91_D08G178400v1 [Gossypium mustelinum]
MPKSTEPKDGSESDTNLFNICILFLFWPYLANPIYRSSNVIVLMKRSLRPLISILMLVALTATLSCWIVYPRCGVFIVSTELESTKFTSIDIGEAKSKLEIKQLLERDFPNQGRQRNFATSKSFSHHDAKSRNSNGLLVLLKSPNWCNFPFFLFFFSSYSSPA